MNRPNCEAAPYTPAARIEIPDGPNAEGRRVFTLRPEMAGTVDEMIDTVYHREHPLAHGAGGCPHAGRAAQRLLGVLDGAAQSVIDVGVPEDDYGHVDEWRTWPGYTERQRMAIEYAERFTIDHQGMEDELFDRMHAHFTDAEILDLTLCLAIWLGLGRTLAVLGVEQRTGVVADL